MISQSLSRGCCDRRTSRFSTLRPPSHYPWHQAFSKRSYWCYFTYEIVKLLKTHHMCPKHWQRSVPTSDGPQKWIRSLMTIAHILYCLLFSISTCVEINFSGLNLSKIKYKVSNTDKVGICLYYGDCIHHLRDTEPVHEKKLNFSGNMLQNTVPNRWFYYVRKALNSWVVHACVCTSVSLCVRFSPLYPLNEWRYF